ncbi:MAG TPA: isochorismatase family cysteine hydrolase [Acidimicrobiales bacterium]|nr:isochorismatase family cysteine hydrolase [Acidimicrobiales bacterium]
MVSTSEPGSPEGKSPDVAHPDLFSAQQATADSVPLAVPVTQTAVLVVDMVNDYLDPAGAMPLPDTEAVIAATASLVKGAQAAGALVAWVRPGHREAADGLFRKRIVHAVGESWGAQFHPALSTAPGEQIFRKRRYSAFFQTDLDCYLREHDVLRVIICGVALNICVRSTVHDAFFLGYDVWVAEDACQATSTRERDSTLYDIETHFGHVVTVENVIEAWT